MRGSFTNLLRTTFCSGLIALLGACSGETTTPPQQCGPNDINCAKEGEPCSFSINCPAGNICNKPTDDLFQSDLGENICVKVVCASDAECSAPKTCSLERICEAPVCQTDNECSGGNICLGGSCEAAPNASLVSSCSVVTPSGAIRQGSTVTLAAVGRNSMGVALPAIRFSWMSNAPNAVSISDDVATGGAMGGPATITARVLGNESVTCDRNVTLTNFPTLGATDARVVLVADDDGAPVDGAEITLVVGGVPTTQMTGNDGSTTFMNIAGTIDSVTVVKAGYQDISVLSPPKDTFIPVPRNANRTMAGGFRGSIDITAAKRGDVKLGIAGPSLPSNLLDFDFTSLIGDSIETTIDAPELGLNNEMVDLPGGVVFALGSKNFTDDSGSSGTRCQGRAPTANELGCYVARAPKGPGAAWVLAGRLTLSKVSAIAGTLSSAFGGGGEELPIGDILTKVLPLLRTLNHGINAGLVTTEFPKVNTPNGMGDCTNPNLANYDTNCQGNFAEYAQIRLAADHTLAIDSAVRVPTLPRQADGSYADGVVVISAAITEGRGMIPLGLSAGLDVLDMETPDGVIGGVDKPFGDNSQALEDGFVPLTMAPAHSGVEGSRIALVAVALDPNGLTGDAGLSFSGLVNFVERVGATADFGNATFLGFPRGSIDVAAGTYTASENLSNATVMRYELQRNGRTWLIYGPPSASGTAVTFPNVASVRGAVLGAGMEAFVQGVRSSATYADVFTFGSGKNLNRAIENIQGFVVQECVANQAMASCQIQ